MRTSLVSPLVSAATALVLLGVAVVPFLTPAWIHFEQGRVGAPGAVAFESDGGATTQRWFADDIVHDLVLGGDFVIDAGAGGPLLDDAERNHMRDVRGVFQGFFLLVTLSVFALGITWRRARGRDSRSAWWMSVRRGAAGLAVVIAALGVISVVAFDQAFEVFHRLFFAAGSYSFDPATSHLVQLFPDRFWSETTIMVAVVAIALAVATAWLATRRAATVDGRAAASAAIRASGPAR